MENYDALGTAKFFIAGEKFKEAKQALDLVRPYCKTIPQLDAIGKLYSEARDWRSMYQIARNLHTIVPSEDQRAAARHGLIRACIGINNPWEALDWIDEQEKYLGKSDQLEMDKGIALFMANEKVESENVMRDIYAFTQDPDMKRRARYNLAVHDIANGNFKEGLYNFVTEGERINTWRKSPFPEKNRWDGTITPNMPLIIVAEGGIGDEIINVRFVRKLSDMGVRTFWLTSRQDLANVFARCGFPTLTDPMQVWEADKVKWCYSMAVPMLMKLDEDDLWDGPYLYPNSFNPRTMPMFSAIEVSERKKIGVKCYGNQDYEHDLQRSIPQDKIEALVGTEHDIFTFNIDGNDTFSYNVNPMKSVLKDWEHTLFYLNNMDIVISSCTSIAHAASAMGKKTVVLVPIMNYYIWAKPGKHSPWYGNNTTIIRQTEPGNWDKPMEELGKYLEQNL